MTVSVFGVVVVVVGGYLLLRRSTEALLAFVMVCTLLGGSAAFILPSLNNVSMPPANLAVLLLAVRCFMPSGDQPARLKEALRANALLLVLVGYGVVGAWLLPRIFEGALDVTPLRPIPSHNPLMAFPLAFSTQNITVSVNLTLTLLAAIGAHMAAARPNAHALIVRTAAILALAHAFIGIAGVLLAGTGAAAIFDFFRNGFYAQVNQSFNGIVRMNGIFAEPAVYAAYGFAWLVFVVELWIRDVDRRWTGPAALALFAALAFSTTSTAYIGLSAYGVILFVRLLLSPTSLPARKWLRLYPLGLMLLILPLGLALARPEVIAQASELLAATTVNKLDSASGVQRTFWAKQGIDAFWVSGGLGVGPGSFRSSSLVTAIIGSVGIIGSAAFLLHLLRVFQPQRRSTYVRTRDPATDAGAAAAWAAVVMLIPVSLTAASPDPGISWAILGGISLAMRKAPAAARRPTAALHQTVTSLGNRGVGSL